MAPEKKLWHDLKKATSERVHWTRLEAWVGTGIPDLNGAVYSDSPAPARGIEFWLELKACASKGRQFHSLWRPGQIAWQTSRCRIYPNVFNLIIHPSVRQLLLYGGWQVSQIAEVKGPCSVDPLMVADCDKAGFDAVIDYIIAEVRGLG